MFFWKTKQNKKATTQNYAIVLPFICVQRCVVQNEEQRCMSKQQLKLNQKKTKLLLRKPLPKLWGCDRPSKDTTFPVGFLLIFFSFLLSSHYFLLENGDTKGTAITANI